MQQAIASMCTKRADGFGLRSPARRFKNPLWVFNLLLSKWVACVWQGLTTGSHTALRASAFLYLGSVLQPTVLQLCICSEQGWRVTHEQANVCRHNYAPARVTSLSCHDLLEDCLKFACKHPPTARVKILPEVSVMESAQDLLMHSWKPSRSSYMPDDTVIAAHSHFAFPHMS